MAPLGHRIDLDALDDLLASTDGDSTRCSVAFTAEGYHVEVTGDEVVCGRQALPRGSPVRRSHNWSANSNG